MLSCAAWGETSFICSVWAKKSFVNFYFVYEHLRRLAGKSRFLGFKSTFLWLPNETAPNLIAKTTPLRRLVSSVLYHISNAVAVVMATFAVYVFVSFIDPTIISFIESLKVFWYQLERGIVLFSIPVSKSFFVSLIWPILTLSLPSSLPQYQY